MTAITAFMATDAYINSGASVYWDEWKRRMKRFTDRFPLWV